MIEIQQYTARFAAQEEHRTKYAKLLEASHSGGCCRACSKSTISRVGLVRCIPKNKTVNGLAVCDAFDKRKVNE